MAESRPIVDRVEAETYGAFVVSQITRDTNLEDLLGLDLITVAASPRTEIHRHPHAENVIYVLSGAAVAIIDHADHEVKSGDRIRIGKGVYHGFRTAAEPLVFVSVQSPPILDKKRNRLDTEVLIER